MKFFTAHQCQNTEIGDILDKMYDGSGKMFRACLLIMCAGVCEKLKENQAFVDRERVYRMAALIELTHYCSLIHDDIIDDSPTRRNKPSVQSIYGKNVAVFAGDILLSKVFYYVITEGIDEISLLMSKLFEEMSLGEIYEDVRKYDYNSGIEDYMNVVRRKTALLFRTTCQIGCICMNADDKTKNDLAELGEKIGCMFQIRDDYLDFISSKEREGKETHIDISEGVYTYPLLVALENACAKEKLKQYLDKNRTQALNEEEFDDIKTIIKEYRGFQKTEEYINKLAEDCYSIISGLEKKLIATGKKTSELNTIREVIKRVQRF